MRRRKFILNFELAPGDITVTTALVRDLKQTYGDAIQLDFRTNIQSIYKYNPYLESLNDDDPEVEHVELSYSDGITSSKQGNRHHFLTWFHRDFRDKTGVHVPVLLPKPDLHLSKYEKTTRPISGRYWLMFAGGKKDIPIKYWDFEKYQQVVDTLQGQGIHVVQSGAKKVGHHHPPLNNVTSVVGWGGIRELIWQIYHAEGIISPVTCAMHMGAALDKPCVVIAGGREEPWWEAYTNTYNAFDQAPPVKVEHRFLHTLGSLDCCLIEGCWKRHVVHDGDIPYNCINIIDKPDKPQKMPACMDMITVDDVVQGVLRYYEDGVLPSPNVNDPTPSLIVPFQKRQAHTRKVIGDAYIPS
jgi:ADP-heptose:LPS heptosyltransferase